VASVRTTISCRLFAQLLTLAACLVMLVRPLAAADVSTQKLPTSVTWTVTLSGPPSAPPIFGADHVYVALQSGVVAAYRLTDGAEVWHRELRTSTPMAIEGGRLFVASGDAIYVLKADDGSPVWHTDAGTLTAPLVAQDGWVIAVAKDQLSAFRATDGTIVWRQAIGATRERPSIEGTTLYLPLEDGRVLALELATGKPKWERRLRGKPTEVLPFADHVYVGSADKSFYCLDTDDGEIAWRSQVGAVVRGRASADDLHVYMVALDNLLRAFDRGNGALRWSPRGVPFRPTAGPVVLGPLVIVAGTTKEIRAFDGKSGQPAGQLAFPEALGTLPAYAMSGETIRIAAVTGNLTQQWTLSLALSVAEIPSIAIEPLTVIPGLSVPNPLPPR
jgi:outer membrane protein assembly factor BamB